MPNPMGDDDSRSPADGTSAPDTGGTYDVVSGLTDPVIGAAMTASNKIIMIMP